MKVNTKEMILIALFAALTALGAFIQIPVGPVPITLQLLFTILAGILLGSRLGALSQLIYVSIGLTGVPVFSGGTGGLSSVISPNFGYLIGFILGAFAIGRITEKSCKPSFKIFFTASLIGIMVVYAVGIPYLYLIKNIIGKGIPFSAALKFGFYVFIPGDILKCVVAAALGAKVIPALKKQ